MKKLVIIDSNAIIHRAFHALPPLASPKGEPTGALYGLSMFLLRMLRELKPDYVAAAFDRPEPTFRHDEYDGYKATRVKAPDELIAQIIRARDIMKAFGVAVFEVPGFEADDIIATLVAQAKKEKGIQSVIVSGDLDTLQAVDDERVVVCVPKKGISETMIYNEKAVYDRFGLAPSQLPDFKGLKGDPSDNVPGVKGIGEKTASKLLQQFGSLEAMYEKLPKMDLSQLKKTEQTLYTKLLENKDTAIFSKYLTTLRYDAPVKLSLDELAFRDIPRDVLAPLFRSLGFTSLVARLSWGTGDPAQAPDGVETRRPTPSQVQTSLIPGGETGPATMLGTGKKPSPDELFLVSQFEKGAFTGVEVNDEKGHRSLPPGRAAKEVAELIRGKKEIIGYDLKHVIKLLREAGSELSGELFDLKIAGWLASSDSKSPDIEKLRQRASLSGIYAWQKKKLSETALEKIFTEIEMPVVGILADMERWGIAVDVDHLAKLSEKITAEIEYLEKAIYEAVGKTFNINSPKQLGEVLFGELKIAAKGVKKTPGGAISTDADVLEKLKDAHPVMPLLVTYRELFKLRSTYIDAIPERVNKGTHRLHTTWNQTGTVTGRVSSENPNLQNIPVQHAGYADAIRSAFVASPEYTLCSFDYSQIELRITASLSEDEKMIEVFRQGEDIHVMTAAEVFGVDRGAVTPAMRRSAKTLNFGIIYGMGADSFARAGRMSRTEAKAFIERYFLKFPSIRQYHEKVLAFGRANGYVANAIGRRRWLPDLTSGHPKYRAAAERMAMNFPIQSLDADIMKKSMIALHRHFAGSRAWGTNVRLLLQIHDQLLFEIRDDILEETAKEIARIMEKVYELKVPLRVDVSSGARWGHMAPLRITL